MGVCFLNKSSLKQRSNLLQKMSVSIKITTVLLLLGLGLIQGFEPGCSFINNQCMYNIRLGHQGKCESNTPTISDASNKGDVDIRIEMEALKKQMQILQRNSVDIMTVEASLNQSETEKEALILQLSEKEAEFSSTEKKLS